VTPESCGWRPGASLRREDSLVPLSAVVVGGTVRFTGRRSLSILSWLKHRGWRGRRASRLHRAVATDVSGAVNLAHTRILADFAHPGIRNQSYVTNTIWRIDGGVKPMDGLVSVPPRSTPPYRKSAATAAVS